MYGKEKSIHVREKSNSKRASNYTNGLIVYVRTNSKLNVFMFEKVCLVFSMDFK